MNGKIAVIGAGTMGAGMALTYAIHGYQTALYSRTDETLERASRTIEAALSTFVCSGSISEEAVPTILGCICYTSDLAAAVKDVKYVAETIVEKPEAKRLLYEQLDVLLGETVILASNTSYLNIFELLPAARRKTGVIVHWVAPPHIIPLVEIVKGAETSEDTMRAVIELHEACGKKTVRMERYVPGFILNRLQSAMTREVMFLLEGGYCTAEDIDAVAKMSLMPRGLLLGVVERMDFNGLDMIANGLQNKTYTPAPDISADNVIFRKVEAGELGVKTGKGFYDYTAQTREETLVRRDCQLIESVRLAESFIDDPLYSER